MVKIFDFYIMLILLMVTFICSIKHTVGKQLFDRTLTIDNLNGVAAAFADFDYNRITDVVIITENGRSLQILGGYEWEPYLRLWPHFNCTFTKASKNRIIGVIAADFTGRGQMDLLVVTQVNHLTKPHYLKLWLFRTNQSDIECQTIFPLTENITSFPLALDFNGDMITDIIVETESCSKQLWSKLKPLCLKQFETKQLMKYPNSNAFIDLSNPKDFKPDIFISGTEFMEYWFDIKGFDEKHSLLLSYPNKSIYKFLGQSAFADLNFDGIIEHIIPVCKTSVDTCEEPQILVLTQNGPQYEWIEVFDTNNNSLTFTQTTIFAYLDIFVTLRVGDMNSDGYPDFVTVMTDPALNQKKVVWLKNSKSKTNKFGRKFTIEWISDDHLFHHRSPYLATVFDFNEDGQLDILVGSHQNNGTVYLDGFINSEKVSSNFLKVFVSTGICYSKCPHISTPLIGSFLCFSPSEDKKVSCAGQISQTQHLALQLPFIVFGLGDIPSYIQNLTVSIPSGRMSSRQQTWYEIIPDSQIVIIPYPANQTDDWVKKLYLDPNHFAFPTLITLTTICCLLVVIIAVLHKKDLEQDIDELNEYKRHWL